MRDAVGQRVVGFIDIGTNSIRMMVVRINANGSYTVISQEKEMVRLGESEFHDNMLIPAAIDRAALVCKKFVGLSRAYEAKEIYAVATSAARDAHNKAEFLERMEKETGIEVSIVSGKEEARLIYLGVSSGINLGKQDALFVDVGGGSCEIMIGNHKGYSYLDSLNLGAIRMSMLFVPEGHRGPIAPEMYARMKKHVKSGIIRTKNKVKEERIGMAIASSGTAINLAQIAAKMFNLDPDKPSSLRRSHLKKVTSLLCSLPLDKRRLVPGMNPERADIILGGAATIETLMDELDIDEFLISERGLRDGMLVDYLIEQGLVPPSGEMDIRQRSVLQLGRSCNFDEQHAERVREMALSLFDSSKDKKLHSFGDWERELLSSAAFLHDIGDFISFNNHHLHSHYIISNAELLGFDQREISIMANVAKFHRKRVPKRNDSDLVGMDEQTQKIILVLSALLRVAESLDRSHTGIVKEASFVRVDKEVAVLKMVADEDCQLECWGVESDGRAFEKAFGKRLEVA